MGTVFLTGATGFVGRSVLRALREHDHRVRCLLRPGSEARLPTLEGVEVVPGDVAVPGPWMKALGGCDAVVHLVGIIREFPGRGITYDRLLVQGTRNVLEAARAGGVRRHIQMSALGTRPNAVSGYHRAKWQVEEAVRGSGLRWTIFRPSIIFGPEDEFVNMLAGMIRRLPVVPVIGDGRYRLQPVAVEDVALGFVRALTMEESVGQTYIVAGPEPYEFNRLLDLIGEVMGRPRVLKLHHPIALMRPLVAAFQRVPFFPLTLDQLTMLKEENVADPAPFARAFGVTLTSFPEGIRRYLGR